MSASVQESQKDVVRDLADIFNQIVQLHCDKQAALPAHSYKEDRAMLLYRVSSDIARIVDFEIGARHLSSVVHANHIASAELSAIELIEDINRRGLAEKVTPILYRVMEDVAAANNLNFRPRYRRV